MHLKFRSRIKRLRASALEGLLRPLMSYLRHRVVLRKLIVFKPTIRVIALVQQIIRIIVKYTNAVSVVKVARSVHLIIILLVTVKIRLFKVVDLLAIT